MMLAILLIVGGVTAATWVMSRGMFAATDAESLEQALALTQEKIESLRGAAFGSIASEAKESVSGWTGFSRQVDVTQPAGTNSNFKQVVVTVYWNTVDGELSTSLTSYAANVNNN